MKELNHVCFLARSHSSHGILVKTYVLLSINCCIDTQSALASKHNASKHARRGERTETRKKPVLNSREMKLKLCCMMFVNCMLIRRFFKSRFRRLSN